MLLAQALFGKPDALLLDEPTNNLDIDSIRWLEKFFSNYQGVLVTISHDRHFLNEICTHIADIDYETIIIYPGGYDDMVMAKSQVRGRIEQENAERKKKIEQLQDFVARFAAGTRASQVQSRKKQIERLQLTDLKRSNIERPFIQFLVKKPSGKQTLTLEGLTKRWPDVTVCDNFTALVTKGEKIAIIGRSGVGKTTLCRMLMSELKPDAGKIEWGHEASVGYLAQDHREGIPDGHDRRRLAALVRHDRGRRRTSAACSASMLFKGDEGKKPTDALSGGEAVRLIFSKLMLTKDNVLVLDEPTNHLDLESIVALGDALSKYEGTAFVVTHDRDLVSSFATRIFAFTVGGAGRLQGDLRRVLVATRDRRFETPVMRALFLAVAVACAPLHALGCGGSSGAGGGGGDAGTTPDPVLDPLVRAFCKTARTCCAASGSPAEPLADCETEFARQVDYFALVTKGTVTIDADRSFRLRNDVRSAVRDLHDHEHEPRVPAVCVRAPSPTARLATTRRNVAG